MQLKERKLRMVENRVLRIFGDREEWRQLHNEELRNSYKKQDIICGGGGGE